MTGSLPPEVQAVFDRFITTELTTVDRAGQPVTWPVTPYYRPGAPCIDVTTGLGYPKKANDARANPLVSLLFSDPTGSGLTDPPTVLVQGSAEVDDKDFDVNRERYARESAEKLPGAVRRLPPEPLRRFFGWYFDRIYVHIRPERVYVWPPGAPGAEPALYDAHMEEVRSGHSEEPERFHAGPEGGGTTWHPRMLELGRRYPTAVLAIVSPDGFPFSMRAPVHADEANRWICIDAPAEGAPLQPGLACLTAHLHEPELAWMENFQVRGDLVQGDDGWRLIPHMLVEGFEAPPSRVAMLRANTGKAIRFRRTAKRELARRR
ncbi:MAG TPA: pyridoxamine 5'-phosphate oxidase family protein [Candidatus Bathyarchaeia archaeon]|nr:pyridoxamine 5'-phosphate oxidase family protein [Candidatus Bathyarchaeia archaeon]